MMPEQLLRQNHAFDQDGRYILRAFDHMRPFSSFLPGIAGLMGIPMWAFYVNRGQALSSFGVESKDLPILEFQNANRAYQLTALHGFRTFLRGDAWFYEPFQSSEGDSIQRDMFVGMNEVEIEEKAIGLGLQTNVLYYTLPEEPFAALVRRLTITNTGTHQRAFEILDGLPGIVPAGVNNWFLKNMGRTIEAWMEVTELERQIPFFKLAATPGDATEVTPVRAGNFALAMSEGTLLPPIVDPTVLFGQETSFLTPRGFIEGGLQAVLSADQVTQGRSPCAFFGKDCVLAAGEAITIDNLYGHAFEHEVISDRANQIKAQGYFESKHEIAQRLTIELTDPVETHTASPTFDAYCRQTMLDNILRGGWPLILPGEQVYHVYSRKHGDPERDYNHFFLAAQPYSQGNSNYRDVNQNRRNDLRFEPRTAAANIHTFMSLMRSDGYNPLVVQGKCLSIPEDARPSILGYLDKPEGMGDLLEAEFTLGELLLRAHECGLETSTEAFLEAVLEQATQHIMAEHGEGFWTDHWTYNLDLIESYLAIYPDKEQWLFFNSPPLAFFDSAYVVQPRDRKYVLSKGQPQQANAVVLDSEKNALIQARSTSPHWVRSEHGRGEIFRLPLISKLVLVALLKFATLDPDGLGIEMEAGKPGWCDALNGLPGLFGSSMVETYELLRLLRALADLLERSGRPVPFPEEAAVLFRNVLAHMDSDLDPFDRWDAIAGERESYRSSTRLGFQGSSVTIDTAPLLGDLQKLMDFTAEAIERAVAMNDGFPPAYYFYRVDEYEVLAETDDLGRPTIRPRAFTRQVLPAFLEGPVRQMRLLRDPEQAMALHHRVKASDVYDRKLGMYRLNASLKDQPHSIGRIRAFTPGWLENESIFLHMSYKYLLELLRAGLVEEFFDAMKNHLVPFFDPQVYGRSVLEHSSFIASSAHPDPTLHGAGFVARLTGATTEFLSMWGIMMAGEKPFFLDEGKLYLALRPSLPGWLFKENGTLSFRFLGTTLVTYHNPGMSNLCQQLADEIVQIDREGHETRLAGGQVGEAEVLQIRDGKLAELHLYFHEV